MSVNNENTPLNPALTEGGVLLWTPFTLVPDIMLDENNNDLWLNFLRKKLPREQHILQRHFSEQQCTCLYEQKNNNENHIIPHLIVKAEGKGVATLVCAYRQTDKVAIVCLKEGRLQLANIYEAGTKEQMLYWVLNIYEQMNLSVKTPLYAHCGESTRKLLYSHVETREL